MTENRMRLGWFVNYLVPAWNQPWSGNAGEEWMDGQFYVDMAQSLDRANFDVMMLEDSTYVSDSYAGTFEGELKYTVRSPKHDPIQLIPMLAEATRQLGFVATMSSSFYPPYLLARLLSTLDHMTEGRVGWNVVTSAGRLPAQNYSMADLPPHDQRYEIAAELIEVVEKLWRTRGPINHHGTYYDVPGALNTLPPLQSRPVISQAGGSPTGRDFAARTADMIVSSTVGIDDMRAYREEIRQRAAHHGRNPDDVRILFMIAPFLAETQALADRHRDERLAVSDTRAQRQLVMMSDDIDWAQFSLDEPLPDVSTNGSQSVLDQFRKWAGGRTLREAAASMEVESVPLAGTPETVADRMQHVFEEVGGDGFLFFGGGGGMLTRHYVEQVCEGLVPELQRRGLVRTQQPAGLFNSRLMAS
ncbi:MAG: LLM class flavin-dependent oxidoreductase [Mycetocola sp.]